MSIEEQFSAAVKVIRSLPKNGSFQPSDELKLTFYAYFKQATEGPNTTKKPAFYDIVNRYKWDAWKKLGDMSRTDAMTFYVEELKKVIETLSLNEEVSGFLDILGPFYEFLPEDTVNNNNSRSNSKDSSPAKMSESMADSLDEQVTPTTTRNPFSTYDSEGEEFSDTLDTTSPQNGKIPVILQNGTISNHISGETNISTVNKPTSPSSNGNVKCDIKVFANSHKANSTAITTNGGPSGQAPPLGNNSCPTFGNSVNEHSLGFNEQLTMAVFKLQHSLDRVVNRIDALESLFSNQSKCLETNGSARSSALSKWLFPELSGRTTAFVIAWPLIAYLVINYVKQIRKK